MSDTNKEQDPELAEEALEPVSDTTEIDEPSDDQGQTDDRPSDDGLTDDGLTDDSPTEEKPVKPRGNGVAWLALLVAIASLAGAGYLVSRDWLAASDTGADDALAGLDNRLLAARDGVSALDTRVAELDAQNAGTTAELDNLRQDLDERVRLLSSLPARMSTLESSVSSLAGISEGARDNWVLAEAEYYMQIANAQLQLAGNPQLAALALRMADERIVQLANPALTDVRRAISDELAALDAMEKPDIAGATLTLASLARVVESLPLIAKTNSGDDVQADFDEEASGVTRAWSSVKSAMSSLVKVTPPDQAKLALLSPDAEHFLRNNLALQLQTARLALLRNEQTVFEQTIDDTSALMSQYFDGDSAQVISAQKTLTEIRTNVFTTSIPDISESLRLLRQFRTLRESTP